MLTFNPMRTRIFYIAILTLLLSSCTPTKSRENYRHLPNPLMVTATAETHPVGGAVDNDGADDPAIRVHPTDPSKSIIIGTQKDSGLYTYDLSGKELFFFPYGKLNNVDIRQDFGLGDQKIDLVAASNRSDSTLSLLRLYEDGRLEDISTRKIKSEMSDEVYGLCLYKSRVTGIYYAFMSSKSGEIEQYELVSIYDKTVDAVKIRTLRLPSQVEGLVADEYYGWLFAAEEDGAIYRFNAEPDQTEDPFKLSDSDSLNPMIQYDLEGLAIYHESTRRGFLVASVQGSNTYAFFDRQHPHPYLFSIAIGNGTFDQVEETDGIDISHVNFGKSFPKGILVVQDGVNVDQNDTLPQNFKIVNWQDIEKQIRLYVIQ